MRGKLTLAILCVLLSQSCDARPVRAETYIQSDSSGVMMLHIEAGRDAAISGALTIVGLKPNGELIAQNDTIVGTEDHDVLTFKLQKLFGPELVTGTRSGDGMKLVMIGAGKSQAFDLHRGTAGEFATREAELRRRSDQIKTAMRGKAEAEATRRAVIKSQALIDSAAEELSKYANSIPGDVARIDQIIKGYHVVADGTANINAHSANADSIGVGVVQFDRDLAISQAEGFHQQVQGLSERLIQRRRDATATVATLTMLCHQWPTLECARLGAALHTYHDEATQLAHSISREQSAYEQMRPAF